VNRAIVLALPLSAILVLCSCSSGSMSQSLPPQNASQSATLISPNALAGATGGDNPFRTSNPVRRLCPPASGARMECLAMERTDVRPSLEAGAAAQMVGAASSETCPFPPPSDEGGYCPNDLQAAYKLPSLTAGKDQVVAIVDAYGYDHAASDLAKFRSTMGLKACGTADKCLRILNQEGKTSPLPPQPPASDDWKGEESLDLDMVSGICPNCKIVLIQATNDDTSNLYAGVAEAGKLAKYVGNSWGGTPVSSDDPVFHQPGVVITAAAGDEGGGNKFGGGPEIPCAYTYVVCVGGTHLAKDPSSKRGWSERVWNDFTLDECGSKGTSNCGATGSGCTTVIAKPSWQTDRTGKHCTGRSEADVSASSSLSDPVIIYNSEEDGCKPPECFFLYGGTSEATQIVSAVFALAANPASQTGAAGIWKHHAELYNVTKGDNIDPSRGDTCASSVAYICTARKGYSGPVGWGTPDGVGAF
jgi:Subtilase family